MSFESVRNICLSLPDTKATEKKIAFSRRARWTGRCKLNLRKYCYFYRSWTVPTFALVASCKITCTGYKSNLDFVSLDKYF